MRIPLQGLRILVFPLFSVIVAFGVFSGCEAANPPGSLTAQGTWQCNAGVSCQNVYDMKLQGGQDVTFTVNNLTGESVAQIALYGPGVALGGFNLINNTTKETLCGYTGSCATAVAQKQTVHITQSGTYRFAITRNWGDSCGGSGTYGYDVNTQHGGILPTQTVTNTATQATGTSCP